MEVSGINSNFEPIEPREVGKKDIPKLDSGRSAPVDRVVISDQARVAFNRLNLIKQVKALPDVRKNLVEKAKKDIASGRIFSQDVAEKTAESILKRF